MSYRNPHSNAQRQVITSASSNCAQKNVSFSPSAQHLALRRLPCRWRRRVWLQSLKEGKVTIKLTPFQRTTRTESDELKTTNIDSLSLPFWHFIPTIWLLLQSCRNINFLQQAMLKQILNNFPFILFSPSNWPLLAQATCTVANLLFAMLPSCVNANYSSKCVSGHHVRHTLNYSSFPLSSNGPAVLGRTLDFLQTNASLINFL